MIKLIYKLIQKFLKFLGWDMNVQIDGKIKENSKVNKIVLNKIIRNRDKNKINLNIGSGDYIISNFMNLDFYNEKYYDNKRDFEKTRIHYDMRNDDIPYDNNFVDNIYCSHVIEHIETHYVEKFLYECHRVLKKDCFLRIACPDSLFLYNQMLLNPKYYNWHHYYYSIKDANKCFVDEVATHRSTKENFGLNKNINDINYDDLMAEFRKDGVFDPKEPGRHINSWDFKRLSQYSEKIGYSQIILSKFWGSSSPEMQGKDMDLTHPEMSIYVEFKK